MRNPYENHGPNLANSATKMFVIIPLDDTDLERVCKSIRIWNPDAANAATIRFSTLDGDDITVNVPPMSVWTEPCVITRVHATGTSAGLIIHGYSD